MTLRSIAFVFLTTLLLAATAVQPAWAGSPSKGETPKLTQKRLAATAKLARSGKYDAAVQRAIERYVVAYFGKYPNGDVMASLFHVVRESIEQANDDKAHFLGKLEEQNAIAEALADALSELHDVSSDFDGDSVKVSALDKLAVSHRIEQLSDRSVAPIGKKVRARLDKRRKTVRLTRPQLKRYKEALEALKKRAADRGKGLASSTKAAKRCAKNLRTKGSVIKKKMRADATRIKRRLKKR